MLRFVRFNSLNRIQGILIPFPPYQTALLGKKIVTRVCPLNIAKARKLYSMSLVFTYSKRKLKNFKPEHPPPPLSLPPSPSIVYSETSGHRFLC